MSGSAADSNVPVLVRYGAAALALAAGLVHLAVTPEHFDEATSFGIFMTGVGLAQLAAGLLLLVRPSRGLMLVTMLGTVAVFVVFAVAYTAGLPLGPHPGERETVEAVVVVSKVVELALVLALAYLLTGPRHRAALVSGPPGAQNDARS